MTNTETDDSSISINPDTCKENIKVKEYRNGVEYKILNYDKSYICFNDIETFKYRSVVLSLPDNKILCFSPPKAIHYNRFVSDHPILTESIYVNEYIEGIMINLFFETRSNKWEIATKSAIGGNYFYYRNHYGNKKKQKTFYQMFMEAFRMDKNDSLSDIFMLNELLKTHSYSFVIQQPDNHIVLDITEPKAFLVAVYDIVSSNTVMPVPIIDVEKWKCFSDGIVNFPEQIQYSSYDELSSSVDSIHNLINSRGVMITDFRKGSRTKIENPVYNQKKTLRGNNANLQYQFLCLTRINKIKEFLDFFPRYNRLFIRFSADYSKFISNVHSSYLTHYVKKKSVIIAKQYLPHIIKIHHDIYLHSLNLESVVIVRKNVVREYFDKMEPRELLYHLNYNIRLNE